MIPLIGPEIPSHLLSRKRSADSSHLDSSPPRRVRVTPNIPNIGPSPVSLSRRKQQTETCEDENPYSEYPVVSPLVAKPKLYSEDNHTKVTSQSMIKPEFSKGSTQHSEVDQCHDPNTVYLGSQPNKNESIIFAPTARRRIIGPTAPTISTIEPGSQPMCTDLNTGDDSSSDSDDGFGPSLPPEYCSNTQYNPNEKGTQEISSDHPISNNKKSVNSLKRAEWMLTPPTSSDWTTRVDPTKLKNRKFASGKGAKGPIQRSGVSAIWTETPEEKSKRLENEVLGRTQEGLPSLITTTHLYKPVRDYQEKESAATELRIREYNKENRSKSLLDERVAAQNRGDFEKKEDDDPSKRAFDREKDMALGAGHMTMAKRGKVIAGAADFAKRFEKGSYL